MLSSVLHGRRGALTLHFSITAAHAVQFGGVNYLAPIDTKLMDAADLHRLVRLDEIVNDLQQAKNLRILVLDACRDEMARSEHAHPQMN